MDRADLAADGWQPLDLPGFSGVVGPFWVRGAGEALEVALLAEPRHCNSNQGTVHGGVITAFADFFLGRGVVERTGTTALVTAQLQLHFVAAARAGDLIVGQPEVVRETSELVFMRGLIRVGERVVASADGICKLVRRPPA